MGRDDLLTEALANDGVLLEDEPAAEWASGPRQHRGWARQEAWLTLARDRARGFGRSRPADVVGAWEACLMRDSTCEEAACALMRVYSSQKRQALVEVIYERCRSALDELGLRGSPALEEVHTATTSAAYFPGRQSSKAQPRYYRGAQARERCLRRALEPAEHRAWARAGRHAGGHRWVLWPKCLLR